MILSWQSISEKKIQHLRCTIRLYAALPLFDRMNAQLPEDLTVTDKVYSFELLEVRGSNFKLVMYGGDSVS